MTSTLHPVPAPTHVAAPTPARARRSSFAAGLLAAVALVAGAVVGVVPLLSPPVPAADAVTGFPLDRAREDLAAVATVPHPMGTAEQASVEAYLVGELAAMGLAPEVDVRTVTMAPDPAHSVWTGTVRNIVARIEGAGPDADQAVLLAAHYDSAPTAPGAGDNGAGVVAVLAAMRALTAAPPPRHDVVAAFVDGEEHEMLGSLALVETATWMKDVRVAVNTEGVGNAGRVTPALTTPRNGWVLGQYLDAVPSPVVYTAFDSLLNATGQGADLGRYQEVVPAGLELVGVGGLPAYHAGTDSAAAMHEGTLAEYGGSVVGLARRLSAADLDSVSEPDLVAFTLVPGVTVAYSSTWSLGLALLAVVAVVVVLALAVRRGRVSLRRALLSWLALGAAALTGILTATAFWLALRVVDPRLSDALNGGVYDRTFYVLGAIAAGAAGLLAVLWPLRRRCTGLEVVAGALVGWSLVALVLAVFLPDAAYAAVWPLLAATAGFGVLAARERSRRVTLATVTLAALPAVLVLSPVVTLYFILAARLELVGLPVATPLPMLWAVLALVLAVPLLLVPRATVGWRPAAVTGILALALAGSGLAVSAASTGPRPDLLVYSADTDAGTARWVAVPERLDSYTGQVAEGGWSPTVFEASPFHQPGATTPASTTPAPAASADRVPPPEVQVLADTTTPRGRELSVGVTPPPGSYAVTTDVRSADGVQAVTVNASDVPAATAGAPTSVRVVAFSPTGIVPVSITVPAGADVELVVTSYTVGLDLAPGAPVQPRPVGLTTGAHELPDAVMVTRVVRLPH